MIRFIYRRLGLGLVALALVSVLVFATAELLPGDVGRTILGPYATNEQVAQLDHQLGVDRPLPVRYASWVSDFARGDWGHSNLLNQDVLSLVFDRLVNSLILGLFALILVVPLSVGLGVLAALRRGRPLDRLITVGGLSLLALPEFVTGVLLLVLFAVKLDWFPVSSQVPSWSPVDLFRQLLLPAVPLMFVLFGYISRMARAGTIGALESNYTRTAILKGLPRRTVLRRHVLRNSLLPTITVISVQVGYLVGGLVVIETIFNYPGIGKLLVDSAVGHDLPVLEGCVMATALLNIVSNLTADIVYALLNPRIRLASAE